MALTNLPRQKRDTSELPRALTQSEIASLRQEMKVSISWAQAQMRHLREQTNIRSQR